MLRVNKNFLFSEYREVINELQTDICIVGSDGRYGKLRKLANLPAKIKPLARDVLWFMVTKPNGWGDVAKLSLHTPKARKRLYALKQFIMI